MRGSCLCGAVTYAVDGPLQLLVHCHCSRCRKAHGAPYASLVAVATDDFRWLGGEDHIGAWKAPGFARRWFCRECGSPLPAVRGDRVDVPAGALDGPVPETPGLHIFVGSKASFVTLADDLPKHDEYPPEWL